MTIRTLVVARCATVALALALFAVPAAAQHDFRSSDQDRPIRVEDAYPLEFLEWEWQVGGRGMLADGGPSTASLFLELKTGFARNWQAGVEAHGFGARASGVNQVGLHEFRGHILFNLNHESTSLPALAMRADVFTPGVGELAHQKPGGRLRWMATRSFGRTRAHANLAFTWAVPEDGGPFWSGGVAFDYPIGLFSKAVVGGVYVEVPATAQVGPLRPRPEGGERRTWVELGSRFQLTYTAVLDFGLVAQVDQWVDGRENIGLVLGISRTFGIPGLMRVPPYPEPSLQ
jgi:hypothetical protein